MSVEQCNGREILWPCRACEAPAGMACSEYKYLRQIQAGFGVVEQAFEPSFESILGEELAA